MVGELCAVLQLPQSTVSRHLKILSDEGWVVARGEGTSRFYSMVQSRLDLRKWKAVPLQARDARHDVQIVEQHPAS